MQARPTATAPPPGGGLFAGCAVPSVRRISVRQGKKPETFCELPGPLQRAPLKGGVVRGDAERTRRLVLEAARREFAEAGFAGARVEDIARSAGVNKQALYYHFGNKDGLFRAVLENSYQLARMRDQQLGLDDLAPREAMRRLIEVTFDDMQNLQDVIAVITEENRIKGRHLPGTQIDELVLPFVDLVGQTLRRGAAAGDFRSGIDPQQFFISIVSMIMFYYSNIYTLSYMLRRDLAEAAALQARRAHVVDILMKSLRA